MWYQFDLPKAQTKMLADMANDLGFTIHYPADTILSIRCSDSKEMKTLYELFREDFKLKISNPNMPNGYFLNLPLMFHLT